jgi:hypothetical protein
MGHALGADRPSPIGIAMKDAEIRELREWHRRTREAFRVQREARRRLLPFQEARFGWLPAPAPKAKEDGS